jgi:hypothetical protein
MIKRDVIIPPAWFHAPARVWLHYEFVTCFFVGLSYISRILAHRGASPETILKAERGVAFRGRGS